ncbi:MAG: hypothetical protein KKB81_05715 [Candidatus Margulisbacteria bacterium]|nr:hypothetical protein [Candidatus Margulisiibacteriota bacterium]MBU1021857.1 hypothetical protein [Candidatus Margulisiibacteriota bacterium]MBU1729016.1 hypothetical protein [Candidatus Margulisiibacteriota bacterium]MBU1954431.1 hypothetical protein [Candidatus Margulisiibacteriota bacterium]
MKDYNQYINELKGFKVPVDYNQQYQKIDQKVSISRFFTIPKLSLAIASAALALFLGFFVYSNSLYQPTSKNGELLVYVFDTESEESSPVIDYIFEGGEENEK